MRSAPSGPIRLLPLALALAAAGAPATPRDPTRPPQPELGATLAPTAGDGARAAAPAAAEPPAVQQLLVVDGRRYAVVGSRLYAEGERLGPWRVERIEDAAVVLRLRDRQHRVALHAQVSKRPPTPGPAPAERARRP